MSPSVMNKFGGGISNELACTHLKHLHLNEATSADVWERFHLGSHRLEFILKLEEMIE